MENLIKVIKVLLNKGLSFSMSKKFDKLAVYHERGRSKVFSLSQTSEEEIIDVLKDLQGDNTFSPEFKNKVIYIIKNGADILVRPEIKSVVISSPHQSKSFKVLPCDMKYLDEECLRRIIKKLNS